MKENYIELGTVSKFTCAVSDPLIFSLIEIVGSILSLVLANTNEIGWSIYNATRFYVELAWLKGITKREKLVIVARSLPLNVVVVC